RMSKSSIIIRDREESHRLVISSRDWGLLWGPFFDEGPVFINAFGVYEHFTVAGGIPDGSRVTRQRRVLQNATRALLAGIERDAELLRYDYSYGFSTDTSRHGGAQGIGVRGLSGIVSTRPHGYCFLKLMRAIDGGRPRF